MFKAIQTSVSGLIASSARLNTAASNIVNSQVQSTPSAPGLTFSAGYTPIRTEQTTTPSGGVRATVVPVSPSSLTIFDPNSPLSNNQGNVDIPNVSLPVEIAEMAKASHAYKANANVLKTLDETFESLLKV